MAIFDAFATPFAPIILVYIHVMGRIEAEAQGDAETGPSSVSDPELDEDDDDEEEEEEGDKVEEGEALRKGC